jgi:hypothetical protein
MDSQINLIVTAKDREILQAVRAIKYGTVLIVIQNSEIVQIESTNKRRFDNTQEQNG